MKAQETPFAQLQARAKGYLEELATVVKEGKNKPFDTVIKDEFDFAQFQVEVGLSIPSLRPEEAVILEGMCRQIERVCGQLEVTKFQRKYG